MGGARAAPHPLSFTPLSFERIRSDTACERSYHVSPLVLVGALTGAVLFVYLVGRALAAALNALKFALTSQTSPFPHKTWPFQIAKE
jgi:hypothetical protein